MKYDCMSEEELALWRQQTARNRCVSPCYDCPLEFAVVARSEGRCDSRPGPGRPRYNVRAGTSSQSNRLSPDAVPLLVPGGAASSRSRQGLDAR